MRGWCAWRLTTLSTQAAGMAPLTVRRASPAAKALTTPSRCRTIPRLLPGL